MPQLSFNPIQSFPGKTLLFNWKCPKRFAFSSSQACSSSSSFPSTHLSLHLGSSTRRTSDSWSSLPSSRRCRLHWFWTTSSDDLSSTSTSKRIRLCWFTTTDCHFSTSISFLRCCLCRQQSTDRVRRRRCLSRQSQQWSRIHLRWSTWLSSTKLSSITSISSVIDQYCLSIRNLFRM